MKSLKLTTIFSILLIASCVYVEDVYEAYQGKAFYQIPFNVLEVPTDEMNPIDPFLVWLGDSTFHWRGLSAVGTVACANCHDSNRFFLTPDAESDAIGGCGEGFELIDGKYIETKTYEGKVDCIFNVTSSGAFNIAYQPRVGASFRFGAKNCTKEEKEILAKHFDLAGEGLTPSQIDSVLNLEATEMQAVIALIKHRQLIRPRLLDSKYFLELYKAVFKKDVKDMSDFELIWNTAMALAAYQRTQVNYKSRFNLFAHDLIEFTPEEKSGFELAQKDCKSCHYSKVWSGDIGPTPCVNDSLPFPDSYSDVFGGEEKNLAYVKSWLPERDRWGIHGEFESLDSFLLEFHLPFHEIQWTDQQYQDFRIFYETLKPVEVDDLDGFLDSLKTIQ